MREQAPQVLRLLRAERRQIALAPGTVILVRHGTIVLREPLAWLADTCIRAEHRLTAETTHLVASHGWAEIAALDSAEVALIPARQRLRMGLAQIMKAGMRLARRQYRIESGD